jgi:hypothetical protein
MSEPLEVFPDKEHTSEVTMWLERGVVLFRVGSFGTTLEWTAQEAREVAVALQELAERADP